jgi:hypothetical protein
MSPSFPRKKKWLLLALAVLVAIVCVPLANREIRSFLLYIVVPAYARDAHFLRLKGKDQTVYLLGTIHKDHCTSQAYSLWHIAAVIDHLKPDMLLVESRPEELAKDNWADGPIEMPFASMTARSLGIRVDGIDWWQRAGSRPGTSSDEREERMFQNVLERLPGHRTVLILVGYSHVAELSDRLRRSGYVPDSFERPEKQALFSTSGRRETFPGDLKHYLQKYVAAARQELEQETDPAWRSAIQANLTVRQDLINSIERAGAPAVGSSGDR